MPRIAIFGSFDGGLHPGHLHVLSCAAAYGDVTVILARDEVIRHLKHREPHIGFQERAKELSLRPEVARVVAGDVAQGEYRVLVDEAPDMVGFGYDQDALRENFLAWQRSREYALPVVVFSAFHPEVYKTSLRYRA